MTDTLAELSRGEMNYRAALNAAARGLSTNVLDATQFYVSMLSSVSRGLTMAWYEGAKECGITPKELTTEELVRMQAEIGVNLDRINALADFIFQARDPLGKMALNKAIRSRLELWLNAYDKTRNIAKGMACGNKKAIWRLGKTKEHCQSCLTFNGRVYRWSTWQANEALPKSNLLCCSGYRCKCTLTDTDQRMTPGPFPSGALCK
jgi:hypothetical protein